MVVECPSRHGVVGRRKIESWDSEAIPKAEQVQVDTVEERGIWRILKQMAHMMADMMRTSKGEGRYVFREYT